MTRVSRAEFNRIKAKAAARKDRRKANAAFIRKMAGRKRLPSLKRLQNILWDKMVVYVRKRDGELCLTCPVAFPNDQRQPGSVMCHIVPQNEGNAATWDLENVYYGCSKCNCYETNRRALWSQFIFPQVFGMDRLLQVWHRARQTVQYRRPDYERMIAEVDARTAAL